MWSLLKEVWNWIAYDFPDITDEGWDEEHRPQSLPEDP